MKHENDERTYTNEKKRKVQKSTNTDTWTRNKKNERKTLENMWEIVFLLKFWSEKKISMCGLVWHYSPIMRKKICGETKRNNN